MRVIETARFSLGQINLFSILSALIPLSSVMSKPIDNGISASTTLTSLTRNDPFGIGIPIDMFSCDLYDPSPILIEALENISMYETFCCL